MSAIPGQYTILITVTAILVVSAIVIIFSICCLDKKGNGMTGRISRRSNRGAADSGSSGFAMGAVFSGGADCGGGGGGDCGGGGGDCGGNSLFHVLSNPEKIETAQQQFGNRQSDNGVYYIGSTDFEMGTGHSGGGGHCGGDSGGGCDGGGE
ncbi:unnamed protein product [Caenorhabditis brenneri]